MSSSWLSVPEFARRASVTRRAALKAVQGGAWRGSSLEVRTATGRGGKGGTVYQVSLRSVLEALGEAPDTSPLTAAQPGATLYDLIAPALQEGLSRDERAGILRRAAVATGKSFRTVERALHKARDGGAVALERKRPNTAGQRRVYVSRAFTRAILDAGADAAEAARIADELDRYVKAYWTSQAANAGWRRIVSLASARLRELTNDYDLRLTPAQEREAFTVTRRFVERHRSFALLNRMKTDAHAHYDARPGAYRDWSRLRPMELVMADVHPLDVKLRRRDGEPAFSVRMVAFMDCGTRRVFAHFINLEKREGVRQFDVARCFADMVSSPDYGMPHTLQLDNGSEFRFFEHFRDALKALSERGERAAVLRSTPYNAKGKAPIESFFRHFEQFYLSLLPGYAGGDRMRQKTANQGREIEAADWTWEQAEQVLNACLRKYNEDARDCLGGRSPDEAFRSANDFSPVTVSREALLYGFAKRTPRRVQAGQTVQLDGRTYRLAAPVPTKASVSVLHWPDVSAHAVVEYAGALIAAERVTYFHPLDAAGARESRALRRDYDRAIRDLGRDLPAVDPAADMLSAQLATIDLAPAAKVLIGHATSPEARARAEAAERAEKDALQNRNIERLSRALDMLDRARKDAA